MRSRLNYDVNAKVKQLPRGQDQTRTSVQRPNFYIQAKIKLGLQYKGQSTTLRSRSNKNFMTATLKSRFKLGLHCKGQTATFRQRSKLDFSVKVKPRP